MHGCRRVKRTGCHDYSNPLPSLLRAASADMKQGMALWTMQPWHGHERRH